MATRAQVQELIDAGLDYEMAGQELGIPAGAAYLIATGDPADGSDGRLYSESGPGTAERLSNPQRLLGVPAHNPTRNATVDDWVRARAGRELTQS